MNQLEMRPTSGRRAGARDAAAGYFRKPNGWITVSQYKGGASLDVFLDRGFDPLRKYGDVTQFNGLDADGEPIPDSIWGPILRHPEGPAEFPIEQIITARWYNPETCPEKVNWKQLKGVAIQQYQCPECSRAPFVSAKKDGEVLSNVGDGVAGLAKELTVGHSWDRLSLMEYGKRMGIDFNAVGGPMEVIEYAYEEESQEEPEETPFEVEDVTKQHVDVARGETYTNEPCTFCGWENSDATAPPMWAQALNMHTKMHCRKNPDSLWSKKQEVPV